MLEALAFSYGLLLSFVFAGAERNHRAQRAHAPMLVYIGYVLCGSLAATSVGLLGWAGAKALGLM